MNKTTLLATTLATLCLGWTCSADSSLSAALSQLSAARDGTDQYHEVANALEDGFFSTVQCVAAPGLGGMGIHYINPGRMFDGVIAAARPEILLYEADENGRQRLVGVEYYAPVLSNGQPWFAPTPPPTVDNPAPVLFGQTFEGPMAGHEPGQPWHYDLHVWIWRHNPSGMFFDFNPKVSCQ